MNLELGHTRLILQKCRDNGLLRNQAAYVLATATWETAHTMEPVREAYWLSEVWRRTNLRYYPWYGRGFVQLTWERNYRYAGEQLGRDLTSDADAVMEPEVSAEILVKGMLDGWFTGKKLSDYVTLNRSDFRGARRIVNGMDKLLPSLNWLCSTTEHCWAMAMALSRHYPMSCHLNFPHQKTQRLKSRSASPRPSGQRS